MSAPFDWTPHCSLDAHTRAGSPRPHSPLGLCAFEAALPPWLAALQSAALPEDQPGRVLFVCSWEAAYLHKQQRSARSWPTVPLLVWAGHGVLRLLYQCTAEEALPLGRRLARLCHQHLQAPRVSECPPGALLDLARRYVAADPATRAMQGPAPEETKLEQLSPWVESWPAERFELAVLEGRRGVRQTPLQVEPPGVTVLTPLTLFWDPALVRPILPLDFSLFYPVLGESPIRSLPMRRSPRTLELFLPLRADNWRAQLLRLREDARERLQGAASFYLPPQRTFPDLLGVTGLHEPLSAAHPAPLRKGEARPEAKPEAKIDQLFNLALQLSFVCEVPLEELGAAPAAAAASPAPGG